MGVPLCTRAPGCPRDHRFLEPRGPGHQACERSVPCQLPCVSGIRVRWPPSRSASEDGVANVPNKALCGWCGRRRGLLTAALGCLEGWSGPRIDDDAWAWRAAVGRRGGQSVRLPPSTANADRADLLSSTYRTAVGPEPCVDGAKPPVWRREVLPRVSVRERRSRNGVSRDPVPREQELAVMSDLHPARRDWFSANGSRERCSACHSRSC